MSTDEAPRPDIGPVTPGTLSVVAAATTARSREFPVEFEPETAEDVDLILKLNLAEQGSAWAYAEVERQDAELERLRARLSEVEAERDALQRQRDEVWHRIDLWSDDPDTGLDHLLDVWTSHEKALAQVEAWRPVVEAAREMHQVLARPSEPGLHAWEAARSHLVAAVDALPTRSLDSTPPGDTDG